MRVVICDDHHVLLDALAATIARAGHSVEATTVCPAAAVAAVDRHRPDLLLLDLAFPDGDALAAAREVRSRHPRTRIVVLTASEALQPLQDALAIGVAGYVRKDQGFDRIREAIERVAAGAQVVDERLLKRLAEAVRRQRRQRSIADELTPRERDIACLLREGLDTTAMVDRLGISESTVRTHVQAILAKLCVHSRIQAVALLVDVPLGGAGAGPGRR